MVTIVAITFDMKEVNTMTGWTRFQSYVMTTTCAWFSYQVHVYVFIWWKLTFVIFVILFMLHICNETNTYFCLTDGHYTWLVLSDVCAKILVTFYDQNMNMISFAYDKDLQLCWQRILFIFHCIFSY